jgi:heme-degrading monooxygenase HmoA
MNHPIESEMVTIEEVIGNSNGWRLKLEPNGNSGFQTLNARGVEFIAKPGRTQDLRNSIRDRVMGYLRAASGFSSAVVLTSHKEPRLVLVLTFWKTETHARNNCWEHAPAVRKMVQPLIDVCSKVQTYEAAVPKSSELEMREIRRQAC